MRIGIRALVVAGTLGIPVCILGCELALDFDRSKVDGGAVGAVDATFPDAPRGDVVVPGTDGPLSDGDPRPEASADAATDAPSDASSDGGSDAADSAEAFEVGVDGGLDAADG